VVLEDLIEMVAVVVVGSYRRGSSCGVGHYRGCSGGGGVHYRSGTVVV
jgi:hypothetical protein